ncbi:hypothetical protein GGR56DRAFT_593640 [Xylariaceae sp. FL0804]|nr:hypothetical protein GGR56DRAFT_593640 [Xylariaceae sp. FL0804]
MTTAAATAQGGLQQQQLLPASPPVKRKRAATSSDPAAAAPSSNKRPRLGTSLNLSAADDARALDAVQDRYDVQLQSVISSSKMQQRVSAVLRHLAPSPASSLSFSSSSSDPVPETTTTTTRPPKPKIAILRARAPDAGKLVSIAEIAKREIENEAARGSSEGDKQEEADGRGGGGGGAGRWYQYIALGEEMKERPRDEGKSIIEETVLGARGARADDNDDDDDDFEVMKTPLERALEGKPVLRSVPVMSLFLSRVPIDELRRRYGEQTSYNPT